MKILLYLPDLLCLITIVAETSLILLNPRTERLIGLFICSLMLLLTILLEVYLSRGLAMSLFMWSVFLTLVWDISSEYRKYRKYLGLRARRASIIKNKKSSTLS